MCIGVAFNSLGQVEPSQIDNILWYLSWNCKTKRRRTNFDMREEALLLLLLICIGHSYSGKQTVSSPINQVIVLNIKMTMKMMLEDLVRVSWVRILEEMWLVVNGQQDWSPLELGTMSHISGQQIKLRGAQ